MMERRRFSVAPAGEFGMSLVVPFTENGHSGTFHMRRQDEADYFTNNHQHPTRLPGITFPESITATNDLAAAVADIDVLVLGTPTRALGEFYSNLLLYLSGNKPVVVCISKGMQGTKTAAEILEDVDHTLHERLVVLSGPNFASEIAGRMPTATTVSSANATSGRLLQNMLNTPTFRVYLNEDDVKGVSYGGAFKNVIAIAMGLLKGYGISDITRASLITSGLEEMMQLGVANGANSSTFLGLSGVGDLIVTCSELSRNFRAGMSLSSGTTPQDLFESPNTIEGIYTAQSVMDLIDRSLPRGNFPIFQTVWRMLYDGLNPKEAKESLMKAFF